MIEIIWDEKFKRIYKNWSKKHPNIVESFRNKKEIELKIQKLTEDLRREVLDYVEFLLNKYKDRQKAKNKFGFDWEGGLSDLKEKFTSVEL